MEKGKENINWKYIIHNAYALFCINFHLSPLYLGKYLTWRKKYFFQSSTAASALPQNSGHIRVLSTNSVFADESSTHIKNSVVVYFSVSPLHGLLSRSVYVLMEIYKVPKFLIFLLEQSSEYV